MEITNTSKGKLGESKVFELLLENNINAKWGCYHAKADFLLSNGTGIDVKFATPHSNGRNDKKIWSFNLHHHGTKQHDIAFFICVLWNSGNNEVFVFPSDFWSGKVLTISTDQLERGKYDYFKNNFTLIKNSLIQEFT